MWRNLRGRKKSDGKDLSSGGVFSLYNTHMYANECTLILKTRPSASSPYQLLRLNRLALGHRSFYPHVSINHCLLYEHICASKAFTKGLPSFL